MRLVVLVGLLAGATDGWEQIAEEDGLVLSEQGVAGSRFDRVRVTGTTRASAEAMADVWWGKAEDLTSTPEVTKREVMRDDTNDRLYWDLISAPPISDRDYVMRETRRRDPATGVVTIVYKSVDDARKPSSTHVRMSLEGSFTATPLPNGGCTFTYQMHTDVGGSVPAVLTRGPQRKSALGLARENRRLAERVSKR
ncbi:MAG: hypothetical protein JNK82_13580 [Myxococcaceae bacterium]|nr:hypothetical protein [Myxococcaceae bacterium]